MKPHKHAELIKAWADGKEIQYLDTGRNEWKNMPKDATWWDDIYEYRIKPEPKPDVVMYMYVEPNSEYINMQNNCVGGVNLKLVFNDGELKSAEVLK